MAKVFEHYLKFPEEMRMAVINEMEPDDRCRFTRCSSICRREVQKCKNYIYGLRLKVCYDYSMIVNVIYHEKHRNDQYGDFNVHFFSCFDERKYIVYSNRYGVELWKNELDSSKNLIEYACENVKCMLKIYQKTIKNLWIQKMENYDFEIRSLSNLESLTISYETDIQQIMSKIRKPLKEFECYQSISKSFTKNFEQIFKVQNWFNALRVHLDYSQFLQLSAANISINIGILTEENISDFIKSWQNDKLRQNFRSCQWYTSDSNFDIQKLLRLLRIDQNVDEMQFWKKIDIGHNMDAGKKAKLGFNQYAFYFRVNNK